MADKATETKAAKGGPLSAIATMWRWQFGNRSHLRFNKADNKVKPREMVYFAAWTAVYLFVLVLTVVQPDGDVKYALHWGIWLPVTSFIVFWEGAFYLRVYSRMARRVYDMHTLIGVASHFVFAYCIVLIGIRWDEANANPQMVAMPWEVPGLLVVFGSFGSRLQTSLTTDAFDAYRKLNALKHQDVFVVGEDGQIVGAKRSEVPLGATIQVQRGQMVLLDGILESDGEFDYANITGESALQKIAEGKTVVSGAYNVGSAVTIKVTKKQAESTLDGIIDGFSAAASFKPRMQLIADRIVPYFVFIAFGIAFATFGVWLALGLTGSLTDVSWVPGILLETGGAESIAADDVGLVFRVALQAGISVLAIACPCALGLATPLISMVTSMGLQRRGITVNKPVAIENIRNIRAVAMDKTGTITESKLTIDVHKAGDFHKAVAKRLEQGIAHPIARAFQELDVEPAAMTEVAFKEGIGVFGKAEGRSYWLKAVPETSELAKTVIGLYEDGKLVADFHLGYRLKKRAAETVAWLKAQGIKTVMMTGDNRSVAEAVGKAAGIDEVNAQLRPEDKLAILEGLKKDTGRVLFIGDGFNDGMATQAADISVAFASGSDVVNKVADFSVASDDFSALKTIFKVGGMHRRNAIGALLWATGYNVLCVPLAVIFFIPAWGAGMLMALSNASLVSGALLYRRRLKKVK